MNLTVGRPQHEIDERARRIRAAFKTMVGADLRERLWNRSSGICIVCRVGMPLSDCPSLQVGHGLSVVQYAASTMSIEDAVKYANDEGNLCILHADCNRAQGAYDIEDYHEAAKRGEVKLDEPRTWTPSELDALRFRLGAGGRISGRVSGRKHVKSGHLASIRTTSRQAAGGRTQGRKNVESGHLARISTTETHAKGGRVSGRQNVESGHLARIRTPAHQAEAGRIGGRIGGRINGRKAVESGQLASIVGLANHIRWHVKRNRSNPLCVLCVQNQTGAAQ